MFWRNDFVCRFHFMSYYDIFNNFVICIFQPKQNMKINPKFELAETVYHLYRCGDSVGISSSGKIVKIIITKPFDDEPISYQYELSPWGIVLPESEIFKNKHDFMKYISSQL